MREKGPDFRIVGGISEEEKEQEKKRLKGLRGEKHLEDLREESIIEELETLEYDKEEEELELIGLANKRTNKLMKEVGIQSHDVPERNFHIVPPDFYERATGEKGVASVLRGSFLIIMNVARARVSPLLFGVYAFHELMHLNSHYTQEVQKKKEGNEDMLKRTAYRAGICVGSAQKKELQGESHGHFEGLNEAVVDLQSKEFVLDLIKHPLLKQERERLNSEEAIEFKKKIAQESKTAQEDIFWVSKDGEEYERIGYSRQRKVLEYVMEQIQIEFPEKYKSKEEVLAEFLKSFFTGHLLPLAKLTEKTFGKGGFRLLGMMKTDEETPIEVFEALYKKRLEQEKKKINL